MTSPHSRSAWSGQGTRVDSTYSEPPASHRESDLHTTSLYSFSRQHTGLWGQKSLSVISCTGSVIGGGEREIMNERKAELEKDGGVKGEEVCVGVCVCV